MQFGINKHEYIFLKTNKILRARRECNLRSLKKLTSAYLFQIAQEKSCDYVLIIYMKKYEKAHHNYAEPKCAHQVQKWFIQTVRYVKTKIYSDIFTSIRRKKLQSLAKQFKELFSLCPNHFRWNGIVVSAV